MVLIKLFIQVKKCMTAMLEGQSEDQVEAIDSLREEYEEHCRTAVSQTKRLLIAEWGGGENTTKTFFCVRLP